MFSGLTFLSKEANNLEELYAGAAANERSNLADIFEADESDKITDGNPTLKYVPPKPNQPRTTADKSSWNVVIAKIVGAFKLLNDTNTSIGQLGLALLKNPAENATKLILYRTKDQVLSTLQLTEAVKVYWKPPYLQYRDDLNGFWSLLFASDSDATPFFAHLKEFCAVDGADAATAIKAETISSKPIESPKITKQVESTVPEIGKETSSDDVDSSTSKTKTKADVVHRVAKIGHQLPNFKPSTDEDSDSTIPSDTEKVSFKHTSKSIIIPDKIGSFAPSHIPAKPTNISVALQPSVWSSGFDLNSFASENRIQNTEVRMNLSKLDSKLDRVLDNIERIRVNSSTGNHDKEEEIIQLEEKLLELKKENRALKLQLTESERAKKESSDRESEHEELIASKKDNEEKDLKISELTKNVQELEEKLSTDVKSNEIAKQELTAKNTELTKRIEELEDKLRTESESNGKEKQQLTEKHTAELDSLRESMEKKINELEALQKKNNGNNINNNNSSSNVELIRGIMNQLYVKLYQSIEDKETMPTAEVLKLIAEIIRKETKAALSSN